MPVTRSVGRYTFVSFDAVLGQRGTTARLDSVLHEVRPDTIAVDLPVRTVAGIARGKVADPFLNAAVRAVGETAAEGALTPYQRAIEWAHDNDAEVKPIGAGDELRALQRWRLVRLTSKVVGAEPAQRLDGLFQRASKDKRLKKPYQERTVHLSTSLAAVVRSETPRTLLFTAYPWGDVVTTHVRRELGLSRMEGERMVGGWPE